MQGRVELKLDENQLHLEEMTEHNPENQGETSKSTSKTTHGVGENY